MKTFRSVKPGDILVFHVLKPTNGVIALCEAKSEVFENHQDIWGKDRYPFRVEIEFMPEFTLKEKDSIPLSSFLGKIDIEEGIEIEPYIRSVWITNISDEQHQRLKEFFRKR